MKKQLVINEAMKQLWPATRVGCLQYKGIGKDEINIEGLPVLADEKGAIGSYTSDSERAMITENAEEVLTLIYSFSDNKDLEGAMEYGKKYLEKYAGAQEIQCWIAE